MLIQVLVQIQQGTFSSRIIVCMIALFSCRLWGEAPGYLKQTDWQRLSKVSSMKATKRRPCSSDSPAVKIMILMVLSHMIYHMLYQTTTPDS